MKYLTSLGHSVRAVAGSAALPASDLIESQHILATNGPDMGLVNELTGKSIPAQIAVYEKEGAAAMKDIMSYLHAECALLPNGAQIQQQDGKILQDKYQEFLTIVAREQQGTLSTASNTGQLLNAAGDIATGAAGAAAGYMIVDGLNESEDNDE